MALVIVASAGCGASGSARGSESNATRPDSMRGDRYCEVLLVSVVGGTASADVYNSYPLNDCPAEQWMALDASSIARAEGVSLVMLNGPRYWLMDSVDKEPGGVEMTRRSFGGIEMNRQANVQIGPLAEAAKRYTPHEVDRSTVFTFDAGRSVYELVSPDGSVWVMQAWSAQIDPSLDEGDLAELGGRLNLPPGWTYRSRVLSEPLRIVTTSRVAKVLQDDLSNSYSWETTN